MKWSDYVKTGIINMTINRELAEDCGLDESTIQEIEALHEKLDTFIAAWVKEPYTEERAEEIHSIEDQLQALWGFPVDRSYHTWARLYEFRCQWVGKKYRCKETGEEFTIPDNVKPRDYFAFGQCGVDVGRLNCYSRMIGPVVCLNEVDHPDS